MAKGGKKEKEILKKNNVSAIIVILIVVITALVVLKTYKEPNYWVDNISINEKYIYFDLFSNMEREVVIERHIYGNITRKNILDLDSVIYFKCHNKKNDDVYYIRAQQKDFENAFRFDVIEDGIQTNNQDGFSNNSFEYNNELITNNISDIDYCQFIGIEN